VERSFAPLGRVEPIGVVTVRLLQRAKLLGELGVVDKEGNLVVEPQAAHVEVHRSEHRQSGRRSGRRELKTAQPQPLGDRAGGKTIQTPLGKRTAIAWRDLHAYLHDDDNRNDVGDNQSNAQAELHVRRERASLLLVLPLS